MKRRLAITDLTDAQLECRLQHPWKHTADEQFTYGANNVLVQYTKVSRCLRCYGVKKERIDVMTFQIIGSASYKYEDDQYPTLGAYYSKADIRREQFKRGAPR